ncbi:MAG: GNAT family N-acetyltransferase [Succinivibrio sp.]
MISIRKANHEDLAVLNSLAEKLVPNQFKSVLNTSQIDFMLDKFYSQKALSDAINSGKIYFIASYEGEDTAVASVIEQGPDLFLMQKLYVEGKNQGKGVGTALFNYILDYVKQKHPSPCTVELLINKHNPGLNFYIKRGMKKIRDTGLDMGDFFINEEVYSIDVR